MKNFFTFFILSVFMLILSVPAFAQDRNNEDEVVHLDPMTAHNAKPGDVIMKFHDRSDIRLNPQNPQRFNSPTRSVSINAVLEEYNIERIEQLLPNFQMPAQTRSTKSYGGQDVVEHDLSQIHLIVLDPNSSRSAYELIEALNELDEVEFAEPNYICYALGAPINEPISELLLDEYATAFSNGSRNRNYTPFTPNDPMYSMQWGIPACHIDSLLTAPKIHGNWRPIIAFLDTGVDIDHPDLAANIWTNSAESNGATGADDDGNGFRDDVHGWDFVNQTGEMHDFNSHGTHCAGIAAAVGNNGIGITGACPDAYIMPITVMQSDGTGDIATIIRGVNYAAQNGADIISMSIGTYAYSVAFEHALGQAYQTAVLVGAAGNDAIAIDKYGHLCASSPIIPCYPAAFTYVFGVQAMVSVNSMACFSNMDLSGPSFSPYGEEELYNYELSAPGVSILSTVPNGQYRSYNGTSMACPLVAGGIASLLQRRDYQTKEILFGDLINYSQEFRPINFWAAYNGDSIAPAMLQCVSIEVNDTLDGDGSMYADAGERLQLYPTLRTMWGPADSIEVWLEFQEFEDANTVHILQNHVQLGHPLSAYAKAKSLNPIDIRIDSNVVDGRHISLTLCASAPNAPNVLRHDFVLQVTNGVKLHGLLVGNQTLYPKVHYIITNSLAMQTGDTLFIKPGTTIKIKDGISINATIIAEGKVDSMITFTKTDLGGFWGNSTNALISPKGLLRYCILEYMNSYNWATGSYYGLNIENSIIRNNSDYHSSGYGVFGDTKRTRVLFSNIINNNFSNPRSIVSSTEELRYCNIIDNSVPLSTSNDLVGLRGILNTSYSSGVTTKISYNHIWNNNEYNYVAAEDEPVVHIMDTAYYGSTIESTIRKKIYDINTLGSVTYASIDLSKRASRPSSLAHGIVWKVEVNGYDAQDEFDSIVPLGVGTHEFKIYFNRAMDTAIAPMVAMGVRPPYTQTAIGENAHWSADSTIYTVHLTLTGRDAIDGLNRIYVANAQDNEHFEIPFENQRFNVQVASSGSMSAGFMATAGIGKVDLEWNDQEVNYEDFLGFNMYRYQYANQLTNYHYDSNLGRYVYDTVYAPTDPILLNTTLIQDTVFTDYDVVPGQRYYYFYKILSTSLTENSPSKTVSCVPNSSIPGDANGSYNVDIADVITTINFVTGQNPQPFLFEAADVNGDGDINVLDIVGIINIILHSDLYPQRNGYEQQTAVYTVEDGILYVNTSVALGGLQFRLANCTYADIELLEAMNGFEIVHVQNPDGSLTILAYSMSGMQVPEGRTALLRIGQIVLDDIVLSDPEGHNVLAINGDASGVTSIEALPAQIMKAFPNPFDNEIQIEFVIGQDNHRSSNLVFSDILGRTVDAASIATPTAGRYSYRWNAGQLPSGIYFATLLVDNTKAHTIKLILK